MLFSPKYALLAFIALISFLIFLFIAITVLRRIVNARRHRILDLWRDRYRALLAKDLAAGRVRDQAEDYRAKPGSPAWQALEQVLFERMDDSAHQDVIGELFRSLGYTAYYEERLSRRSAITSATAADKLGRMRSAQSVPKLAEILAGEREEPISVALRALGRINTDEALSAVLHHLPRLVDRYLVSRKTVQAALELFTGAAPDRIVKSARNNPSSPRLLAYLLGGLCALPRSESAVLLAREHLSHRNAEVRAKALKLISIACVPPHPAPCDAGAVIPLLRDPVWFVRFHALRAVQSIGDPSAVREVGVLLFDENWQVRNAAAAALTTLGPGALKVFLEALRRDDRYARESICEEIERTRFTDRLFAYLGGTDAALASASRAILEIMRSLRFSTPLVAYARHGGDPAAREQARAILASEAIS